MIDNPFTSVNFTSIWSRHFSRDISQTTFDCIQGLSFVKHKWFLLYTNVGRNNTKGMSYYLKDPISFDYKKKVFLIYDVPQYFNIRNVDYPKNLCVKKARQYPGFLINLKLYNDLEGYLKEEFSKSSRYKLKKYHKRLENSFNISYKMFYGDISAEEHASVFRSFRTLLIKRFSQKETVNNNLDEKEWNFFKEVSLPMILEKKASLFVVYAGEDPIAITLSFLGDAILFDAITVFDTDYSKFNLGYINIMSLIEWCLKNDYDTLDFSKGYFDYKQRWGNKTYDFEYHILYDSKYLPALIIANTLAFYFRTKQKLREWKISELLHKATYILRKKKNVVVKPTTYEIEEVDELPRIHTLEKISMNSSLYEKFKKPLFSFLYLNAEHIDSMTIYRQKNGSAYFFKGEHKVQKIYLGDK